MDTLLSTATRRIRPRPHYGWWIVGSFVTLNVYWAGTLIYGLTVFFTPVRHTFGWSTALLALILSLSSIVTGLLAPLVGAWFDRSGPRNLMLLATGCTGIGLLALSRTTSLATFVAAYALVSIGFGIWASGTGIAAAGLWFERRRGLAMGIVLAGVALGGVLVPVWNIVVETAGWRTAFLIAGIALLAISLPACLVLRHRPEDLGLRPYGADNPAEVPPDREGDAEPVPHAAGDDEKGLSEALHTRRFWTVAIAAMVVLAGSQAAQLLMLPRLQEAGLGDTVAVTAVTAVTLLGALGRLGNGGLADRIDPHLLAALGFVLQGVGLFAFAITPDTRLGLLLFVFAFGLGSDNMRLLAGFIFARYFGALSLGRIQGALYVVLLPGRVLGPVFVGVLHDRGAGYGLPFALLGLATLAMTVPMLLLKPPAAEPS